ncbi:MAG TPA: GAF domain-containing protein [Anaerolineales bacterium]|nr:GAF domain-containing protein [Anaerolineales bacterium]
MKSFTTGQLRDPNNPLRARNALRIAMILLVAFLLLFGLFAYFTQVIGSGQLYVLAATTFTSAAMNALALRYGRQKHFETAAYLMMASIVIFCPVATFVLSGVGLALGMCSLAAILMIASLTLLPAQITPANVTGILFGIALILLDTFFPSERLEIQMVKVFLPAVAVTSLGFFSYYVMQQFSNYPLRTKLVIFFIMVAIFSVGTVAVVTNILARNVVEQQVGQLQQNLAERLATDTGKELESNIEILQATATQFEEFVANTNDLYVGEQDEILKLIMDLDNRWGAADDQSLLIRGVINNAVADELREFQEHFPHHVELFITDKYGANIGATNRTTDYYQADEDWWKAAYNQGQGRVYIGQPEFDDSSQTYAVIMAIPLSYEGEVVGILRSTLEVTAIVENLQQGSLSGTIDVDLRVAKDTLLNGHPLPADELSGIDSVMGRFGEINYEGVASLVSQQRVFSSANSSTQDAVSQLGWSIIVHRDLRDALEPIQQQARVITMVALVITVLVGILGLFASQRLAAPILSLTDVTRRVTEGDLAIRAHITTQDEIGALANSFNRMTSQLQDTMGSLERRVAERTADLELSRLVSERRAQELQSISEISRTISTEQRLEILLPLVTRLVSERFDFSHVGIFFVDDTKQFVVLQASNSAGGKRMLARGHLLAVGTGIVGNVALSGKPRIALDVGSDAVFFDNPDLPETRSEMALPLNFRGDAIGVLDVQSTKPGAFTEGDVNILSILADQIAIAIQNARLFGQTQQAREEAENLYNQFHRTEWKTFLQQNMKVGYRQTLSGGQALQKPIENDEIRQALHEGRVVVLEGNNDRARPSIAVPVQLRGQTLGILNITGSKNRKWNQDEINLAQAISDRLALALDNARLLQESQRRAAKEAKIGEVTSKIGASINMRNVLQTAVEELGRALPGSEIVIQFQSSQEN